MHVSYEEGSVAKSRDKYLTSWQTPQTVTSTSLEERIHAGNSKLLYFYSEPQPDFTLDMQVRQRDFSGSWSSPFLLHVEIDGVPDAANTFDGKTHIVYRLDDIYYRNYNGSTWSSETTIGTGGPDFPKISSVSNDIFVIWENSTGSYLSYRQYDANPLTQQNLQIVKVPPGPNYLVKVTWTANSEPDLLLYEIWRRVVGTGCSAHDWQLIGTSTTNSYIDNDYFWGGSCYLYYKTRAKDIGNHYSDFSAIVSGGGQIAPKLGGKVEETVSDYFLSDNYPNPFNPSTTIDYAIKFAGHVTLKVYDMLGREVSNLVNEDHEPGQYSVVFNASNLPSGVYVYSLRVNDFVQNNKMTLLK